MIKAILSGKVNLSTFNRIALCQNSYFSIFDIETPFLFSKQNIDKYNIGKSNFNVGLILSKKNSFNSANLNIASNGKIAVSFKRQRNSIIRLVYPGGIYKYTKWLKELEPFVSLLEPSYVMVPINSKYNLNSIDGADKVVAELNENLFLYALENELIIYQQKENISSLAYILNNVGYSDKIFVSLNLDYLQKQYASLSDIYDEIYKYNIQSRVIMIYSNNYDLKNPSFKKFCEHFDENLMTYGKKI